MRLIQLILVSLLIDASGAAAAGSYYTKVNVNDAPDGGRFSIEAFMLDAMVDSLDTRGRPLLLRFARSSGNDSYLITWDMAISVRKGKKHSEGLTSLGRLPLDGYLRKNEEVWALWWVSWEWGWESPRDLSVVYGDAHGRLVPLDEKTLKQAMKLIPKGIMENQQAHWQPDLGAFDVLPGVQYAPAPIYPRAAEGYGDEGRVTLAARVGIDGTVANVVVLHSTAHHVLNVAALKAVSRWTFTPGTKAGKAVEGYMVVPIRFAVGGK